MRKIKFIGYYMLLPLFVLVFLFFFQKRYITPDFHVKVQGPVNGVALSSDGRYLAVSSSFSDSFLIYDIKADFSKKIFQTKKGDINQMAFSLDGQTLAVACSKPSEILFYNPCSGSIIKKLTGHSDKVTSITFNKDNKTFASGSIDGTVKVWNLITGELLKDFSTKKGVYSLEFSPVNVNILAFRINDQAVELWNWKETKLVKSFRKSHSSIAFSPDGNYLFLGNGSHVTNLDLFGVAANNLIKTDSHIFSLLSFPKRHILAIGCNELLLYDIKRKKTKRIWKGTYPIQAITVSNEEETLVVGAGDDIVLYKTDSLIKH